MKLGDIQNNSRALWRQLVQMTNHREAAALTAAASLLLLISLPAFKYFFFAENFTYLHIYRINNNNLIQAAFSRMVDKFFRPGFFFADIGWHFILPPDPMLYHLRNLVFCIVNLVLLHRLLLRFVQSRRARHIALFLFAASKIHLTIIGYINAYEISVLLMFLLLTVLFWSRYLESRKSADFWLAIWFFTLASYCKENGFLIIVVLGALVFAFNRAEVKAQSRYWLVRFTPFLGIALSYWILRFTLIGPFNNTNPLYAPMLSFSVARWQTKAFLATVGNFSLTNPSLIGSRGLTGLLSNDSDVIEYVSCAFLYLLIAVTVWRARENWRMLLVPVLWIVLYLSPIFLIRNHQVYYHQEPLVGIVLLIGVALNRAGNRLLLVWSLVIGLVAINGFVSNLRSYYPWQFCADQARVVKPIVEANRANPPSQIILRTSPERRTFWNYTVGYELIPHLLGSSETEVLVVDSDDAPLRQDSVVYKLD